jgi:hypothetical protein
VLPVPRPLPAAIERRSFGEEGDGPVRPGPAEVREITETHGGKMGDLLAEMESIAIMLGRPSAVDQSELRRRSEQLTTAYREAVLKYAEDFGEEAARRLDAWVRREHSKRNIR